MNATMSAADSQQFDLLLRNIDWLITVDSRRRVIRDAAIGVRGGRIAAVAKSAELTTAAAEVLDCQGMVATPGFIDAHLHSSFHLSRGLADEANAQSFLFDRMYPYEAALESGDVRVSAQFAASELLRHGVTCFIDRRERARRARLRAAVWAQRRRGAYHQVACLSS